MSSQREVRTTNASQVALVVKNPPPIGVRDSGSIPGWGKSPRGEDTAPTPVLWPGKSPGQRSLVGCSPWGYKELDTTEAT